MNTSTRQYRFTPACLTQVEKTLRTPNGNIALGVASGITLECVDAQVPGTLLVTGVLAIGGLAWQMTRGRMSPEEPQQHSGN